MSEKIIIIEGACEYTVIKGNLRLHQTIVLGDKHNDCMVDMGNYFDTVSECDDRFKPLFIALHHHKHRGEF